MLRDARGYQERLGVLAPPPEAGARWAALAHWTLPGSIPFPADTAISARSTTARVERGMWIVDCPCGGAQIACRTDHRFFCCDCGNAVAGGSWVNVSWPSVTETALAVSWSMPHLAISAVTIQFLGSGCRSFPGPARCRRAARGS